MAHFTEEQLQELATIFGLTRQGDVLPVRDGFVTKERDLNHKHHNERCARQ